MSLSQATSSHRIFGVGNAGGNFLDQLLMNSPSFRGLVAINNDPEALAASVLPTRIALTQDQDIEVALEEVKQDIETELAAASTLILCGGLGGRTTSALLPILASMSKAKTTIACVSTPFLFEGKRAQALAAEALLLLEKNCDAVFLLDNNALCSNKSSGIALGESFVASDEGMKVVLPALLAMFASKGPVRINRSDLLAAMSRSGAKTHFGYGKATGANRLHEAIEQAFKNPLLDRGRALIKTDPIFVLLRGPKDISFAEAQVAMQEIERVAGEDHDIQLSVQAEESPGEPLQIFILGTSGGDEKKSLLKSEQTKIKTQQIESQKKEPQEGASSRVDLLEESPCEPVGHETNIDPTIKEDQPELSFTTELPAPMQEAPLAIREVRAKKTLVREALSPISKSQSKPTQGALNLTAAQRGRFDKSEPTIVEGEDLDTPTYLRLGLKLSAE